MEEVSVQTDQGWADDVLYFLMPVLNQSRNTLKQVTLHLFICPRDLDQLPELLSTASSLKRFIIWDTELPLSRLVPSNRKVSTSSDRSSKSGLELLWVCCYTQNVPQVDNKGLKSLLSFSQAWEEGAEVCRALLVNFSETIIHLKMSIGNYRSDTMAPIVCPRLKVLEGYVLMGVSAFFDAQNLEIIVLRHVGGDDLELLPSSLEEIWLMEGSHNVRWEPLLRSCPKLKILKMTEKFLSDIIDPLPELLEFLEEKKIIAQDGKIIDGVKMIPLQKLILPTPLLSRKQLNRAREGVEEVVDVKDYRETIEIEY